MIFRFRSARDSALILRVANGDRRAFRLLYQRFTGPVHRCVQTSLPFPEEVPAGVCATFVEVWWLARHHRGTEPREWILGIAGRRAAERRRNPSTDWPQPRESSHVALAELLGGRHRPSLRSTPATRAFSSTTN